MRIRWVLLFGAAMLAGAIGRLLLLGPAPAGAVAREIIELQTGVNQLIQGQQALQTSITQSAAVQRTLMEQSLDAVNKLSVGMSAVQKNTQDFSATSGARLDTMAELGCKVCLNNVADLRSTRGQIRPETFRHSEHVAEHGFEKLATPPPAAIPLLPQQRLPLRQFLLPAARRLQRWRLMPWLPTRWRPSLWHPVSTNAVSDGRLRQPTCSIPTAFGTSTENTTTWQIKEFSDYLKYYGDTDLASNWH